MALRPSPHRTNIADLAAQGERDRLGRHARAWACYDGEGPKALEVAAGEADDNIRLDYGRLIVDKGVSFLAGKGGVTLQLDRVAPVEDGDAEGDGEDPQQAAAEQALADAWPLLHLDFHDLATNGGVCGHAWLRIHETGRVSVLDPGNVSVDWNEDDYAIVERYRITWDTVDRETGLGVVRRKRVEPNDPQRPSSWTIYDEELDDDTGQWVLTDTTPWPRSYAPIIGCKNLPAPNTFYGAADLECAILDQIEQLESIASDMRRIVRLHGHPIPVVIGEEAFRLQELDVAIGALLAIPNAEAKLDQLAIAELTSSLALYTETKAALFESAHIPKVALGDTANAGPTAAVALKVEYAPLIERTETKHLTYGPLLKDTAERLLDLLGFGGWRVTVSWPDPLPADEQAEATTSETELRMGIVSKQTLAEKRGYDWEVEQERIAEEKQASVEAAQAAFNRGDIPGGTPYDAPPESPGGSGSGSMEE